MNRGFKIIIPARYQSSRFQGKALAEIAGKPMVQHVYERAQQSGATSVVIATDDERIRKVAQGFGAAVCMTSDQHQSGSDRLAEAVALLGYADDEVVVNLQSDEPLVPPGILSQIVTGLLTHPAAQVATICEPLTQTQKMLDPNVAKVVRDQEGYALYFSRSPLPYARGFVASEIKDLLPDVYYRHIGLYAARVSFWQQYVKWGPCQLEELEGLEQLRVLWHGGKIIVGVSSYASFMEVNTPEDLMKVRALM